MEEGPLHAFFQLLLDNHLATDIRPQHLRCLDKNLAEGAGPDGGECREHVREGEHGLDVRVLAGRRRGQMALNGERACIADDGTEVCADIPVCAGCEGGELGRGERMRRSGEQDFEDGESRGGVGDAWGAF